jgi:amidase
MYDLLAMDATATVRAVARGELSAMELLDARRVLLAEGGDTANAIVDTDFAAAAHAASDIDARARRGEPVGALAGVPMTVKDSFTVAGMRTTHGRLSDARFGAPDAPAVARLRAADAVLFGKSNVPELLADYQTANVDFGRTLNPWGRDLASGGSSGGAAVAVATGISTAELGSDLAGSIRVPAAFNGIFGHRPSNAVVSKRGHMPWAVDSLTEPPHSVSGPLARSARDLELMLPLLAGASGMDAGAWRLDLPTPSVESLRGLAVGVWADSPVAPVSPEMRAAVGLLAARIEHLGGRIVPLDRVPGDDADGIALFDRLAQAEIAHSVDDATFAASAGRPGTVGQAVRDTWRDQEAQRRLRLQWSAEVFSRVDVVLAPAVFGAAPLFDERPVVERTLSIGGREYGADDAISAWSKVPNVAMLPCTVVPLPAPGGLPLGGQLIGPYLHDLTTLRVAVMLEEADAVRFVRPPGWRL